MRLIIKLGLGIYARKQYSPPQYSKESMNIEQQKNNKENSEKMSSVSIGPLPFIFQIIYIYLQYVSSVQASISCYLFENPVWYFKSFRK